MTTNPPETHVFDRLNSWAALDDVELQLLYSEQNASLLREIVSLLGDEDEKNMPIDRTTFVPMIRKMRQGYRDGSRLLGKAIIAGSDLQDRGNIEEARQVYKQFLLACPSEFYRRIARYQMEQLKSTDFGSPKRLTW